MTQPLLEIDNVSQHFGAFSALTRVSVAFEAGQLAAIIGPNGAGKSTFFDIASGSRVPSEGRIRFNGEDVTGRPQHEFARMGIAKSFQITNIFGELSAHENVRVAVQMRFSRYEIFRSRERLKNIIDLAMELLVRVGLSGMEHRRAGDLAHGQQRCLEVAMALASRPRLLLLDEPTAGMSPEETKMMMELIRTLAQERTVILVEHKMKLVMGICERLVVLHHGELLADGTPEEIRGNAEVRRVYLGQK